MHKPLFLFVFIVLAIISGCKKAPRANLLLKEDLQQTLDKYLSGYKQKFPGRNIGFGLYVKGTGKRVDESVYVSSGFPKEYGENIQFRGASTTKSFTAAAILKLSQQNKLNLDDVITGNIPGTNRPYIPATGVYAIPYKDKVTIRLLLQHRAGVFDVSNDDIPNSVNAPYAGQRYFVYMTSKQGEDHTFTLSELINVAAANQLSYFEPGAAFHYSNTGYDLLGTIIERISGKRYDQFLQDEFLTPLQMNHTRFPYLGADQDLPDPHVEGWIKYKNDLVELDQENVSIGVSEANIITTPSDLAKWANALYAGNQILNEDMHAQMIKGIPTNEVHGIYGLGCEMHPADIGYGHNGTRPGYMTTMRYHPGSNTSYILFCNFMDYDEILRPLIIASDILFKDDTPGHIINPDGLFNRSYVFQQFSVTKPDFSKGHELNPNFSVPDSDHDFADSDDWDFTGGMFPKLTH